MALGRTGNRRRSSLLGASAGLVRSVAASSGRWVLGLSLAAALGLATRAGWQWALRAPSLGLTRVAFVGLNRASEADLLRLSGLTNGQNLISLDVASVEKSLLAHPWVERVSVMRQLPHGLMISVAEHQSAAIASLGELYLVDAQGVPFKRLSAQDDVDLPLITGLSRDEYVEHPDLCAARISKALAAANAYMESPAGHDASLSEVRIARDELTLVTGLGQQIMLGADPSPKALTRLSQVRAELSRRGLVAEVIHLDNRARPGWVTIALSAPPSERGAGPTK